MMSTLALKIEKGGSFTELKSVLVSEFIVNPIHFGTRINQMHKCFNEKHTDRSDAI